jgi:hypothetical protein
MMRKYNKRKTVFSIRCKWDRLDYLKNKQKKEGIFIGDKFCYTWKEMFQKKAYPSQPEATDEIMMQAVHYDRTIDMIYFAEHNGVKYVYVE